MHIIKEMTATTPTKSKLTNIDSAAETDGIPATDHGLRTTDSKVCFALDLGLIDYREAWSLQEKLVAARVAKCLNRDVFLFLEHPAVFTLGRRGGLDNLLVSEAFLKNAGIPVVQVERGGFITYHGPGQIVVYPIIHLHAKRIGVKDFVAAMEEAMLRTAATWSIPAERNPVNSGIWVGGNKMGSIGIALRKGVSFHGLALNVNLDLTPFSWIQPCGLQGVGMTSMAKELEREISLTEVRSALRDHLAAVLGMSFEERRLSDLGFQLDEPARG
jgi:lipoate-protein ligase B